MPLTASHGGDSPVNWERLGAAWAYLTDPSGLQQLGARFYWPEVGRFVWRAAELRFRPPSGVAQDPSRDPRAGFPRPIVSSRNATP